jgi:flagellar protein FliS
MYSNAAQAYRTQATMTASPAQMVALLLDRCLESLHEAMRAIDAGDIARRATANKRAREILLYMSAYLDHDNGGEIAENLRRLYAFAQQRLADVDFRSDKDAAQEVIDLIDPLRQSWHELARGRDDTPVAAPIPAETEASGTGGSTLNLST